MTVPTSGPAVGDPAPDLRLLDLDAAATPISILWAQGPAVVAFLRYFGCPFCQAYVSQLGRLHRPFEQAGASIVLIGQGTPERADAFTRRTPMPMLVDVDGSAYRAYGLVEGSLVRSMGPPVWASWIKANLSSGTRQRGLEGGSMTQLPGTFIVGGDGIVRFAHRNRHAADDPEPATLLRAVRALSTS
jgi:peroxiredoxin